MSSKLSQYKEHLFSLHIIDEGVSVHNEKYADLLDIDDILVFGFISALHSYTFSVGQEEVKSIDFGLSRFLFEPLDDGKLIVAITKSSFPQNEEEDFLKGIKLRYSLLTETLSLDSIDSLLDIKERAIPLDLVAEIRKKGIKEQKIDNETQAEIPLISIPEVKIEEFYIEKIMNEEVLTENRLNSIKKSLSSFFLGYKYLIAGLFVIVKKDQLTSFVFSRKKIDEIFPLIQEILKDKSIIDTELTQETKQINKTQVENQEIWTLTYGSTQIAARAIFFSLSSLELNEMTPHLSRILYFVNKII
ncbi:MAG: hypothetical protein ACFFDS_09880 [Candidatus Thorarchaeota archaeon]